MKNRATGLPEARQAAASSKQPRPGQNALNRPTTTVTGEIRGRLPRFGRPAGRGSPTSLEFTARWDNFRVLAIPLNLATQPVSVLVKDLERFSFCDLLSRALRAGGCQKKVRKQTALVNRRPARRCDWAVLFRNIWRGVQHRALQTVI